MQTSSRIHIFQEKKDKNIKYIYTKRAYCFLSCLIFLSITFLSILIYSFIEYLKGKENLIFTIVLFLMFFCILLAFSFFTFSINIIMDITSGYITFSVKKFLCCLSKTVKVKHNEINYFFTRRNEEVNYRRNGQYHYGFDLLLITKDDKEILALYGEEDYNNSKNEIEDFMKQFFSDHDNSLEEIKI